MLITVLLLGTLASRALADPDPSTTSGSAPTPALSGQGRRRPGPTPSWRVHDRWALEVAVDVLHCSDAFGAPGFSNFNYSWTEVLPVVGIMWNVWLNEQFGFYPKAEIGYAFGWFSDWQDSGAQPTYGGLFADGAVGALYKVSGGLTLRGEVGYAGLKPGTDRLVVLSRRPPSKGG